MRLIQGFKDRKLDSIDKLVPNNYFCKECNQRWVDMVKTDMPIKEKWTMYIKCWEHTDYNGAA